MHSVGTIRFAGSEIFASRVALGFMRASNLHRTEAAALVESALQLGINLVDVADVYGGEVHGCERRLGESLRTSSLARDDVLIQTKVGIVREPRHLDSSFEHIVSSVNGSLRALGTDRVDVLLLHRPDALVEPDEVARAFDELFSAGKVRCFGVSNHTPRQIDLLKKSVTRPIVVNQLHLSLVHAPTIAQGLAANVIGTDQAVSVDGGGIVDYCRLHDVAIQAWSPFQNSRLDGSFIGDAEYFELNGELERLSETYGVEPLSIATAWLTRHPARIQVVAGTTRPARLEAIAAGSRLMLTRAEWYRLLRVAGNERP